MHTAISPPRFVLPDKTVNESTDVTVFCTSSASPTPHVFQWRYKGRLLSSNAVLQLNNVQRTQTGVYTCTTANLVGIASANITLTVQCEWEGRGGREEGRCVIQGEDEVSQGDIAWSTHSRVKPSHHTHTCTHVHMLYDSLLVLVCMHPCTCTGRTTSRTGYMTQSPGDEPAGGKEDWRSHWHPPPPHTRPLYVTCCTLATVNPCSDTYLGSRVLSFIHQ